MKLSIGKLKREIRQRAKEIIKNKKYIRQYLVSIKQKIKLPYLWGGIAVASGVVVSLLGFRYWRHRNDLPLNAAERKELLKAPKIEVTAKKSHRRLAYLMEGIAVLSSVASALGISRRFWKG